MVSLRKVRADLRSLVRDLGVLQARYPELGLGVSQCHALLELEQRARSVGELAQLLRIEVSTATRNLQTLERHELTVSGRDPADSRRKLHRLTAKGRSKVRAIHDRGDRVIKDAFRYLTPTQERDLRRGLALFAKALERSGQGDVQVRPSRSSDNSRIATIIRSVLEELGQATEGSAYFEPTTDRIHETYRRAKGTYLVLDQGGQICGGGGVFPHSRETCELKNMYLLREARGHGYGKRLMNALLARARADGSRRMFLETHHSWSSAVALYEAFGFAPCDKPSFYRGHAACNAYYDKRL